MSSGFGKLIAQECYRHNLVKELKRQEAIKSVPDAARLLLAALEKEQSLSFGTLRAVQDFKAALAKRKKRDGKSREAGW